MKYISKFISLGLSIGLIFTGTCMGFGYFQDKEELDITFKVSKSDFSRILWEIEDEYINFSKLEESPIADGLLQDKYILNIPYKLSRDLYTDEELKINIDTSELIDNSSNIGNNYEVFSNYDLENENIEIQIINKSENEEFKLTKFEENNIANLPKIKISASILTNDGLEEVKLQDYYVYIGMKDSEGFSIIARVFTEPLKIEDEVLTKEDNPVNSEVIEQSNKENKPVRPSIEEQPKEENSVKPGVAEPPKTEEKPVEPGVEEQPKEEKPVEPGVVEQPNKEEKPVKPGVVEQPNKEEKPVKPGLEEQPNKEEKPVEPGVEEQLKEDNPVESEVVEEQNKAKIKTLK